MLRYCIAILLGATNVASQDIPLSKEDDGYGSIQLMLKRDTSKKPSHFYYPMIVHGLPYDMQVSSFGSIVGIVGNQSPADKCSVPRKITTAFESDSAPFERSFKDFKDDITDLTGFRQESFIGGYVEQQVTIQDSKKKNHMLVAFPIFKIAKPTTASKFTSNQSGFIGFGPYTKGKSAEYKHNVVDAMRLGGGFSKQIVSYNITWGDNVNSYIQIGDISEVVKRKTQYQFGESFDHFGQRVSQSLFKIASAEESPLVPFAEFDAQAVFDPQVDYMYVNEFEFSKFIGPALYITYANFGQGPECENLHCYWKMKCDKVTKRGVSLLFKLGLKAEEAYDIEINIEDYLVDSADLGIAQERCYIPIFVADPGQQKEVFNTWFLGNMFLDKYFVVHDVENVNTSDDLSIRRLPRIGIYDKVNPRDAKSYGPTDKPTPTPVDPANPSGESSGMGAGWVIFILLIIFGGIGGIYYFFGQQIKEKLQGGGTGTFESGTV